MIPIGHVPYEASNNSQGGLGPSALSDGSISPAANFEEEIPGLLELSSD
jgi:hypothetical protein